MTGRCRTVRYTRWPTCHAITAAVQPFTRQFHPCIPGWVLTGKNRLGYLACCSLPCNSVLNTFIFFSLSGPVPRHGSQQIQGPFWRRYLQTIFFPARGRHKPGSACEPRFFFLFFPCRALSLVAPPPPLELAGRTPFSPAFQRPTFLRPSRPGTVRLRTGNRPSPQFTHFKRLGASYFPALVRYSLFLTCSNSDD